MTLPVVTALIWLLLAGVASEVADRKGRRRWPWFLLGLFVSGLLAVGLVLTVPDPRQPCPSCGTRCPDDADACRGCGRGLPVRSATEPESPVLIAASGVVITLALLSLGFAGWTWAHL